jgi:hypothetical protein
MAFKLWGVGGIGYGTGTPPALQPGELFASSDTSTLYIGGTGGSPTPVGGGGSTLPTGVIVMWSGLLSAIPTGWLLCDGTSGTPDLRSMFIQGAAAGQNPGATGGASTHTHTASWPAGVPTISGTAASFSGNALGTHSHELPFQIPSTTTTRQIAAATFGTGTSRAATAVSATGTANTTSAAVALTQAVSAGTPSGTVTVTNPGTVAWPAGVPTNASASNVPPFFALAFIMKS